MDHALDQYDSPWTRLDSSEVNLGGEKVPIRLSKPPASPSALRQTQQRLEWTRLGMFLYLSHESFLSFLTGTVSRTSYECLPGTRESQRAGESTAQHIAIHNTIKQVSFSEALGRVFFFCWPTCPRLEVNMQAEMRRFVSCGCVESACCSEPAILRINHETNAPETQLSCRKQRSFRTQKLHSAFAFKFRSYSFPAGPFHGVGFAMHCLHKSWPRLCHGMEGRAVHLRMLGAHFHVPRRRRHQKKTRQQMTYNWTSRNLFLSECCVLLPDVRVIGLCT